MRTLKKMKNGIINTVNKINGTDRKNRRVIFSPDTMQLTYGTGSNKGDDMDMKLTSKTLYFRNYEDICQFVLKNGHTFEKLGY